jgi:hypothetical protein
LLLLQIRRKKPDLEAMVRLRSKCERAEVVVQLSPVVSTSRASVHFSLEHA